MLIVNFGQVVDLERGGEFTHQFTIVLQDGHRISIATDEETVRQLMQVAVGTEPEKVRRRSNNQPQHEVAINEEAFLREMDNIEGEMDEGEMDEGELFGGDYDPSNVAEQAASSIASEPEPVMGVMAEQPAPQSQQSSGLGQGPRVQIDSDGFAMPPTARTVQADEKGYPIVSGRPPEPTIPDDDGEDDGTQM